MITQILTPIDGSENSNRALELACDLANKYNAGLTILQVIPSLGAQAMVVGSAAVVVEPDLSELEANAKIIIADAQDKARKTGVKSVNVAIEVGTPAKIIVAQANSLSADMIVMGSRGLSDFEGLLLGSVSHKVSHLAKCSCITVH
ncbi:MAG: nucleotide-binding universal stress UspA family protein [Planctomycetota bacterium]|jgi:nucleotide-binding universal stress UspA family protein